MKIYHEGSTWHAVILSAAIDCAMQLDSREHVEGYGLTWRNVKKLRRGCKVSGSLDQLEKLAYHMTRDSGWELPQQTIYACNQAAEKITTYVREQREYSKRTGFGR